MMVPLYGFLEGDTVGLLILAHHDDTIAAVAEALVSAAGVRVAPGPPGAVVHRGRPLDPTATVSASGVEALDRIDVKRRQER